jgi:hypothetical protein
VFSRNIKNSQRLVFSLLRTGCKVSVIGSELNALSQYNNYEIPRVISLDEAKSLFKDGRILAFFSDSEDTKLAEKDSLLIGTKVFAPLICAETRTPFD